jgi:hypothetical protein
MHYTMMHPARFIKFLGDVMNFLIPAEFHLKPIAPTPRGQETKIPAHAKRIAGLRNALSLKYFEGKDENFVRHHDIPDKGIYFLTVQRTVYIPSERWNSGCPDYFQVTADAEIFISRADETNGVFVSTENGGTCIQGSLLDRNDASFQPY